jgi:GNAT superfamily N-acetyltransferase
MNVQEGQRRPMWRPMSPSDLPAVFRIADALHPDAREQQAVFEEKLRLFPGGCFALEDDGAVLGYAISHPWLRDEVPPLDAFLGKLPDASDCLFLHDVAIVACARGYGSAADLIERLTAIAQRAQLGALALVALYGSDKLWGRLGFCARRPAGLCRTLASYGVAAVYMMKRL